MQVGDSGVAPVDAGCSWLTSWFVQTVRNERGQEMLDADRWAAGLSLTQSVSQCRRRVGACVQQHPCRLQPSSSLQWCCCTAATGRPFPHLPMHDFCHPARAVRPWLEVAPPMSSGSCLIDLLQTSIGHLLPAACSTPAAGGDAAHEQRQPARVCHADGAGGR